MTKSVQNKTLFANIPPLLAPLFENNEYPWDVLKKLKERISQIIDNPPQDLYRLKDGILVGENVKIHPSAVIEAPAILLSNTEIRPGAYLRGYVFCGENCVIGNSTELKHCILMDRVQVPHYNYVGDSILGEHAHMGAGSVCSNLKSDGKNVVVHGEIDYETNLRKLGGILADGADIGCGCVVNPGTVIGKNTSVYPLTSLRGVYPENCIVKGTKEYVSRR